MSEFYGSKGPVTRGDYVPGEAKGRKYTQQLRKKDITNVYWLKRPITMVGVSSSNVSAFGYERSGQILQIEFLPSGKKGYRMYRYFNVPPSVAEAFYHAHSKGTFVWKFIRGKYPYKEISAGTLWQTVASFVRSIMRFR